MLYERSCCTNDHVVRTIMLYEWSCCFANDHVVRMIMFFVRMIMLYEWEDINKPFNFTWLDLTWFLQFCQTNLHAFETFHYFSPDFAGECIFGIHSAVSVSSTIFCPTSQNQYRYHHLRTSMFNVVIGNKVCKFYSRNLNDPYEKI